MKVSELISKLLDYNSNAVVKIGKLSGNGDMDYVSDELELGFTSDDLTKENADMVVFFKPTHEFDEESVEGCGCDDCTCKK